MTGIKSIATFHCWNKGFWAVLISHSNEKFFGLVGGPCHRFGHRQARVTLYIGVGPVRGHVEHESRGPPFVL
ncbi:unnamed protein product [Prunus armeniaca]